MQSKIVCGAGVLLLAAACVKPRSEPELAALRFVDALTKRDCAAVWSMLSSRTRHGYELIVEFRRETRAERYYCSPDRFERHKPERMKLRSQDADRAVVVVPRGDPGGYLVPGFFPTKTVWTDDPIPLVREDGAWRIEDALILAYSAAIEKEVRERQVYESRMRSR